jgi:hypothetical protein
MKNEQIISYLRGISSSDILPPAHAVTIRKFEWEDTLVIWFRSMLWGQTYISSVSNYGPWNNTQIKLFHIKQQPDPPSVAQQTQAAVTNAVVTASPRPSIAASRVSSTN